MTKNTLFIAVLSCALMIVPIAIDLYLPAFPDIARGLGTPIANVEQTVGIYLVGSAIGQIFLGPLSDRIGRRRILIGGLSVFAIASAALGMTQSIEAMQGLRFVQALGGAATVTVLPIARDLFGEKKSAQAISFIMAAMVIAPVLAPLAGAQILGLLGWRAIFLAVALFAIAVILSVFCAIPQGGPAPRPVSTQVSKSPYLTVLRDPRIILPVGAAGLSFCGLFAFVAGSPTLYMVEYGVSASTYGILVGMNAAAMIAGNALNGSMLDRFHPRQRLIVSALGFGGIGLALIIAANILPSLSVFVALAFCYFFFLALVETNAIILALAPRPEVNGAVSALSGALQAAAGAVGSFAVSMISRPGPTGVAIMMAFSAAALVIVVLALAHIERRKSGNPHMEYSLEDHR